MNKASIIVLNLIHLLFSNNFINTPKNIELCPKDNYMTLKMFNIEFSNQNSNTVPSNSNDVVTYFSNLYKYSPMNSYGSCGYVSLIQYLSYYDTFYNDSIIPENYERSQGNVATFEEAFSISPGVIRQDYP